MTFNRGDIVWVKFPFSDNAFAKFRPALILSNKKINQSGDYLLMQVTSVIRKDELSLDIDDSSFKEETLLKKSQLRIHKVFILNESLISGKITSVNNSFLDKVINRFTELLRED